MDSQTDQPPADIQPPQPVGGVQPSQSLDQQLEQTQFATYEIPGHVYAPAPPQPPSSSPKTVPSETPIPPQPVAVEPALSANIPSQFPVAESPPISNTVTQPTVEPTPPPVATPSYSEAIDIVPHQEHKLTGAIMPRSIATPNSAGGPIIPASFSSFYTSQLRRLKMLWGDAKRQLAEMGQSIDLKKWRARTKPYLGAASVGLVIYAIFNSQLLLGQLNYLISPGADAGSLPAATQAEAVSPEPLIIIPKINLNVPVVYDEPSFDEKRIQGALERGVVHYGSTAIPGQKGNNVIVGHSSNNWWSSGKFKFAFVLLNKLEIGDTFFLHHNSQRFTYEVIGKRIVEPTDLSVTDQNVSQPLVTLVTCDPPGTSWKRLVVQAKQINPDPSRAESGQNQTPAGTALPGDDSSFWGRLSDLFD